jgi:hypothetical protein
MIASRNDRIDPQNVRYFPMAKGRTQIILDGWANSRIFRGVLGNLIRRSWIHLPTALRFSSQGRAYGRLVHALVRRHARCTMFRHLFSTKQGRAGIYAPSSGLERPWFQLRYLSPGLQQGCRSLFYCVDNPFGTSGLETHRPRSRYFPLSAVSAYETDWPG